MSADGGPERVAPNDGKARPEDIVGRSVRAFLVAPLVQNVALWAIVMTWTSVGIVGVLVVRRRHIDRFIPNRRNAGCPGPRHMREAGLLAAMALSAGGISGRRGPRGSVGLGRCEPALDITHDGAGDLLCAFGARRRGGGLADGVLAEPACSPNTGSRCILVGTNSNELFSGYFSGRRSRRAGRICGAGRRRSSSCRGRRRSAW